MSGSVVLPHLEDLDSIQNASLWVEQVLEKLQRQPVSGSSGDRQEQGIVLHGYVMLILVLVELMKIPFEVCLQFY
jgi:hypothetical protein